MVFSEGDGLSGLTVDRYDRWLVVQFTALGLAQRKEILAEVLGGTPVVPTLQALRAKFSTDAAQDKPQ